MMPAQVLSSLRASSLVSANCGHNLQKRNLTSPIKAWWGSSEALAATKCSVSLSSSQGPSVGPRRKSPLGHWLRPYFEPICFFLLLCFSVSLPLSLTCYFFPCPPLLASVPSLHLALPNSIWPVRAKTPALLLGHLALPLNAENCSCAHPIMTDNPADNQMLMGFSLGYHHFLWGSIKSAVALMGPHTEQWSPRLPRRIGVGWPKLEAAGPG